MVLSKTERNSLGRAFLHKYSGCHANAIFIPVSGFRENKVYLE